MTTPSAKTLLPSLLTQNPAPVDPGHGGQGFLTTREALAEDIFANLLSLLPSNYVASTTGADYTLRLKQIATTMAQFQIEAQEAFADTSFDFTRSEMLYSILGSLVFPDMNPSLANGGLPDIDGDLSYRTFLQRMVALLLAGPLKLTLEEGLTLLDSTYEWEVIEKALQSSTVGSAWGVKDSHSIEINVFGLPVDYERLQENVRLVMRALKPAHVLYDYRHVLQESFTTLFTGEVATWELLEHGYEDLRVNPTGRRAITGSTGAPVSTDRSLWRDSTLSFEGVTVNSILTVESVRTPFQVLSSQTFVSSTDTVARAYITSSGLSGTALVEEGTWVYDPSQNFSDALVGETFTFTAGPNAGVYLAVATDKGYLEASNGTALRLRLAPSLLVVTPRLPVSLVGVQTSYEVTLDRLGQTEVQSETEDITSQLLP